MTKQEIQELVKELEERKVNQEKLTDSELCILDVSYCARKEGKEITEYDIEFIRFMMD